MNIPSNMSAKEAYRLCGRISEQQMERLLSLEEKIGELEDVSAHISEAEAQLPTEDFLETIAFKLEDLADGVRKGEVQNEIRTIVGLVREVQLKTFRDAEEALGELNKAAKIIDKFEI